MTLSVYGITILAISSGIILIGVLAFIFALIRMRNSYAAHTSNMNEKCNETALKSYLIESLSSQDEACYMKRKIKQIKLYFSYKKDSSMDDYSCSICLEPYSSAGDTENIGYLIICGHFFHFECLWEWLKHDNSCPICRQDVEWSPYHIAAVSHKRVLEEGVKNIKKLYTVEPKSIDQSFLAKRILKLFGCSSDGLSEDYSDNARMYSIDTSSAYNYPRTCFV